MIRRALAELRSDLLEVIASIRTGVDAREVLRDVQWETELRTVVGTDPAAIDSAREAALELAKLGVRPEEILPMAGLYRIADGYGVNIGDVRTFLHARGRGIVPPTQLAGMSDTELAEWLTAVQIALSAALGERARRRDGATSPQPASKDVAE